MVSRDEVKTYSSLEKFDLTIDTCCWRPGGAMRGFENHGLRALSHRLRK